MRETLLASARARLDDPADLFSEAATEELVALTALLATGAGLDIEVMHVLGQLHLLRASRGTEPEPDWTRATLLLMPLYLEQPTSVPEALHPSFVAAIGDEDQAPAVAGSNLSQLLLGEFIAGHRDHGVVAVALLRHSMTVLPTDHPRRPLVASNLGFALLAVEPESVDEALALLRESFAHTPPADGNHARCAHGLAVALQTKAIATEDLAMLDDAIAYFRIARDSPTLAPADRPELLAKLAVALLIWLSNTPTPHLTRRDEAVAALREAIELLSDDAPELPALQEALDSALTTPAQPEVPGLAEMLDVVGKLLGQDATGDSRHAQLAEFGRAVQSYPDEASVADIRAKAVEIMARQVEHLPPEEQAEALRARSADGQSMVGIQFWDGDSLDEVADLVERLARELPDDHPRMPLVRLSSTQLKLMRAATLDGPLTPDSLDRLSTSVTELLAQLPALIAATGVSMDQVPAFAAFGHALLSPFQNLALIDKAMRGYRERLTAAPDDLSAMTALAHTLFSRHGITQSDAEYEEALALTRQVVARTSPPDPGLVLHWAHQAGGRAQRSRLDERVGSPSLVRTALDNAAKAIGQFDGPGALETLEGGRALMLSAAVNTRQELAVLRRLAPELADEFRAVRDEVYAGMNPGWEERPEAEASLFRERMGRWQGLVDRIVALPGFERFMLPLPLGLADLRPAAADGPVVTVNVSDLRCDALVLTTDGVRIVPLPGLRAADVAEQVEAWHRALGSARMADHVLTDILGWLWDVVAEPVLTALGFEPFGGGRWPRLWWSPTGLLNLLPLHAAGYHGEPGRSVLDRVVSSYTPTVSALLRSRSHPVPLVRTALAVAVPDAPGQVDLPATVRETVFVTGRFPGRLPLVGPAATHDAVRAALPGAGVAHFACHAVADGADSRLLLVDSPLSVAEISQLSLEETELVCLSACSTARGTVDLADEAVHAASAFQLAGYPQVVASLWEVDDERAAEVTSRFYSELVVADGVRLDGALALHGVMRELRGREAGRPTGWAGWLHAGV